MIPQQHLEWLTPSLFYISPSHNLFYTFDYVPPSPTAVLSRSDEGTILEFLETSVDLNCGDEANATQCNFDATSNTKLLQPEKFFSLLTDKSEANFVHNELQDRPACERAANSMEFRKPTTLSVEGNLGASDVAIENICDNLFNKACNSQGDGSYTTYTEVITENTDTVVKNSEKSDNATRLPCEIDAEHDITSCLISDEIHCSKPRNDNVSSDGQHTEEIILLRSCERKRKKNAEPSNWTKNVKKYARLQGMEYKTYKQKIKCARSVALRLCKHKQCEDITEEERQHSFTAFWKLNS